jgi:hypothetical protein
MAKKSRFERLVESHWDIDGLAQELCNAAWHKTEPHRYDRMIGIGSYEQITESAESTVSKKEWREAKKFGDECEIVDDYLNALSAIVSEKGKCVKRSVGPGRKEWRPGPVETIQPIGHVYGTYEDGECYLGQYEEGVTAEELKAMGHEVEE